MIGKTLGHYQIGDQPLGRGGMGEVYAPGEWYVTYMQNGRQYLTVHRVISKDGKTMTRAGRRTDAQGQSAEQLLVFERQ